MGLPAESEEGISEQCTGGIAVGHLWSDMVDMLARTRL